MQHAKINIKLTKKTKQLNASGLVLRAGEYAVSVMDALNDDDVFEGYRVVFYANGYIAGVVHFDAATHEREHVLGFVRQLGAA
jgi:hypothetical protein